MDEQQYVALPKLYGAPAYARPPRPVELQDRPFDPDDLPLEAFRATEDVESVATLPAEGPGIVSAPAVAPPDPGPAGGQPGDAGAPTESGPPARLQPRPFSLKSLARRIGNR